MLIVFNLMLIALAGLITYWWANQGAFSALLHLVCVIVAGAVAFAFWEPLTGVVLRGSFFDDYAWGVSLIALFSITLLILRVALDKLAPANMNFPHWVNLTAGGAAGAASAVLSVGIFVIGAGHLQTRSELMGFRGWARSPNQAAAIIERNDLWLPFHQFTADFYSLLSVTSLATSRPLRHYAPELDRQVTLVRDSYGMGKGKLSLRPDGASVKRLYYLEGGRTGATFYVEMEFRHAAFDAGVQLTLSSSQVRLIGDARGLGKPDVVHPSAWVQHSGFHKFDDLTHFASSEPGKEKASPIFQFDVPRDFVPRFIQIRGTRYALPEARPAPAFLAANSASGRPGGEDVPVVATGQDITSRLRVSDSIRPATASRNTIGGGMEVNDDGYMTSGAARIERGRGAVGSRQLAIQGIYEPGGTRCVRLDVSRGGAADVFQFAGQVEEDAQLALVDSRGNSYSPVGYFYKTTNLVEIKLEPVTRLKRLDEIPTLPTSGDQQLELIFYVTEGATITGFRYGDVDVGFCSFEVPKKEV